MSTRTDAAFHLGEKWTMSFTIRDAAGAAIDLTGKTGGDIEWRLASSDALIMKRIIGDGITIDPDQVANKGKGLIVVTPAMQTTAGAALVPAEYDHQLDYAGADSTQVFGKFKVARSLKKQFP